APVSFRIRGQRPLDHAAEAPADRCRWHGSAGHIGPTLAAIADDPFGSARNHLRANSEDPSATPGGGGPVAVARVESQLWAAGRFRLGRTALFRPDRRGSGNR